MLKLGFVLLFVIGAWGCTASPTTDHQIYWVNSYKAKCVGVAPRLCLQIQRGDTLTDDGWQLFYNTIHGFDYELGYLYKIEVSKQPVSPDKIPADGSSIRYTLRRVLSKQFDSTIRLNDIWLLERINTSVTELNGEPSRPTMEIDLQLMQISGNDGCHNFTADIIAVNAKRITFGPIASADQACMNKHIAHQLITHIRATQSYTLSDMQLSFFDQQGVELLRFKKID
ncbi:DUF4377 domain-containing protein [Thalassotalea ponticola]|uniref:DUF4377 domain-containing protein n=1 Tax=Thalassotalea ponticola TaxID=1523392 RepID=UPI0025B3D8A7|nr:DUF4377 domain-containing protein [Thalassotalea ponticola]MDN3652264.1 DUF4377 domain-containing protein [Thalassotalea ponticola]